MQTGNGVAERALQIIINLITADLDSGDNLTKGPNWAPRVMRLKNTYWTNQDAIWFISRIFEVTEDRAYKVRKRR